MKRRRVLIVSAYYDPFIGGVETHAKGFAEYLRDQGTEVRVLTKKYAWRDPARMNSSGITVERVLPGGQRSGLRKWLMLAPAFARMVRLRDAFDVIYCPGYQGIGVAALLAGRVLRKPVIVSAGNLGVLSCRNWDAPLSRFRIRPDGFLARSAKAPFRRLYASADAHVCIAREIEEEALAAGVPRESVHYIPNAVDTNRFQPPTAGERDAVRDRLGLPLNRPICLFVGRLSEEKGILELLEAWTRVPVELGAHLVVVGPDMTGHPMDAGPRARAYVREHGLEARVSFLGGRDDVADLMRAADVFVQPSRYEAFGISVIEAMAVGLPVVATAVGGMLDYLVDGRNALLCAPGSTQSLAAAIERLIREQDLVRELGQNARRTVEERFSTNAVFSRLAHVIEHTRLRNGKR